MRYVGADIRFDVPDDWQDRTIVAFAATIGAEKVIAPNVVLTRESIPEMESVVKYADRQLVELAKRLDSFELLERRELFVSDLRAVELRFAWKGTHGSLTQQQRFLLVRPGMMLTFVVTALGSDFKALESTFQSILDSIQPLQSRGLPRY